jgi:hypothetical protein
MIDKTATSSFFTAARRPTDGEAREQVRLAQALGRKLDPRDPRVQIQSARDLLAENFFRPLLDEARAFPLGKDFLHGGRTEEVFSAEMNRRLADSMATHTAQRLAQSLRAEMIGDRQSTTAAYYNAQRMPHARPQGEPEAAKP